MNNSMLKHMSIVGSYINRQNTHQTSKRLLYAKSVIY